MELPVFRYHPDPIASGSIIESDERCHCCGVQRGFIYRASVYWEGRWTPALCPWCIADGAAHKKYDASFNDTSNLEGNGIAANIVDEVAHRTPSFPSWQQERWLACCADAAAFLDRAGYAEIQARHPKFEGPIMKYFVDDLGLDREVAGRLLRELRVDLGGPTVCIFECLHCKSQKAYIDSLYPLE